LPVEGAVGCIGRSASTRMTFRSCRGCHTALTEVAETWKGTAWFIEGEISDCFGSLRGDGVSQPADRTTEPAGRDGCDATPTRWRTTSQVC
jgi:hypothetical protein